jgi:hypothetical protein
MGMGMGAAENGAAWEAPKSPFDGACWLGGTFLEVTQRKCCWREALSVGESLHHAPWGAIPGR